MTRRTVLLGLLGVAAAGLIAVLAVRGTDSPSDAPDPRAFGEGPWAQVTLRVEGMT